MKNLIYVVSADQADCLERVSDLLTRNYRVKWLLVRKTTTGQPYYLVKVKRSVLGYCLFTLRSLAAA